VPLAFATMIIVSLSTRSRIPANVGTTMLRLHAPDALRQRVRIEIQQIQMRYTES